MPGSLCLRSVSACTAQAGNILAAESTACKVSMTGHIAEPSFVNVMMLRNDILPNCHAHDRRHRYFTTPSSAHTPCKASTEQCYIQQPCNRAVPREAGTDKLSKRSKNAYISRLLRGS